MREYLVAAFKLLPGSPTFLEGRDALLAAALAGDPVDAQRFWAAFATRGFGVGASGPTDRFQKCSGKSSAAMLMKRVRWSASVALAARIDIAVPSVRVAADIDHSSAHWQAFPVGKSVALHGLWTGRRARPTNRDDANSRND